ncbi:hypothetical protein OPV22_014659 [Ensete ventricosum]|uniref:THH1/TOM1/TOM3 domain-containing protein n=1 Tax=Ensete ventricosum TaxID=4639 RepID=A0AAV8PKR1_ENSVE|nr:hypothetical protein OPV22_014659 [Ensete ventricosum]
MAMPLQAHALGDVLDWWEEVNNSTLWQDRIFHGGRSPPSSDLFPPWLSTQIQLVRTEFECQIGSLVFIFRRGIQQIKPEINPTYPSGFAYLISLKWNVMQTHLISTDGLRPCFSTINAMAYAFQFALWLLLRWKPIQMIGVSLFAAIGFLLYGGSLLKFFLHP